MITIIFVHNTWNDHPGLIELLMWSCTYKAFQTKKAFLKLLKEIDFRFSFGGEMLINKTR